MKRYRHEPNGGLVPHGKGRYVDADIAQSLYSALKESRAVVQGLIYEGYMGYLPLRSKIDIALEKADKE